jgi:flagellar biosynthesis protein FlhG
MECRILDEEPEQPRSGEIWTVAGGKGGTGKTFLVSCMGTLLAKKRNRVTLVDLDLGGANLHSFLGLLGARRSLTSFFESNARLEELDAPTGVENLSLISGNVESVTSGNIKFSQKLKLLRQLAKLHSRYLIIDLGAGCHPNTLDMFIAANRMIVVLIPEITSVENVYIFIKNALFRKLKGCLKGPESRNVVRTTWNNRQAMGLNNIKDLVDYLRSRDPALGAALDRELAGFRVHLVVNMARDQKDLGLGLAVKSILLKYLGLEARFSGPVSYDDAVWRSLREGRPFMLNHVSSPCIKQIEEITSNILEDREVHLTGSQL